MTAPAADAPSFEEAVDAFDGIDPGLDDDLYAIDPVSKEDDDTQAYINIAGRDNYVASVRVPIGKVSLNP